LLYLRGEEKRRSGKQLCSKHKWENERGCREEDIYADTQTLTGETWNLMKIGYQLKQVRERLAKGLVDKGILRTEKRNFLLFDMATHPVTDNTAKDEIRRRVRAVLTNRTVVLPPTPWLPEEMDYRYLRTIAMLCAAYAANVLENALSSLGHEARERAFAQVDEMLAEYSQWPFGKRSGGQAAMGANLDAVIREEIGGSQERELQMEVCSNGYMAGVNVESANSLFSTGCRRVLGRLYSFGLSVIRAFVSLLACNATTKAFDVRDKPGLAEIRRSCAQ
jgi:hypothetical protein